MALNKTESALLQLLSLEPVPSLTLSKPQWEDIFELADRHHLAPRFYTQLNAKRLAPPPHLLERAKTSYVQNTGRNLTVHAAFAQLCSQLNGRNIPVIPLKGVYLADQIYPSIGERILGDLDLLVPKAHVIEAFHLAWKAGYQPTKPAEPAVVEEWLKTKHQLCPQRNDDTQMILEWHWHILERMEERTAVIEQLWERAVPTQIFGQDAFALTPEDTILHLANHLSYHHDFLFGLRSLCDLALFCHVKQDQIEWDTVSARAQAWQIDRGVYVAVLMAHRFLGAPVPQSFFEQAEPADFSEQYVVMAIEQLLLAPKVKDTISVTRQKVATATGVVAKVRALFNAVFPSPGWMATRYGITPGSKSRLGLYWVRWRSLAQFALHKYRIRHVRETAVSTIMKRQKALAAWLAQSEQ